MEVIDVSIQQPKILFECIFNKKHISIQNTEPFYGETGCLSVRTSISSHTFDKSLIILLIIIYNECDFSQKMLINN